jgi:DNA-binding NtrC family response regulator
VSEIAVIEPPRRRSLLLLGDEPAQTRLVTDRASRAGWHTVICGDAGQALAALQTTPELNISAIVVDEDAAGQDVGQLISELKRRAPCAPVLIATANPSPALRVEAIRAGASECLLKPISTEPLMQALRIAATASSDLENDQVQPFAEKIPATVDFSAMVGADPVFRKAMAQAATAARGHSNVLVEGETGTGKDMLVRAMQAASPRAKMPSRMINARGLTPATLESALFGHLKGAFPGAFENHLGLLQECDGGTLMLDEINRLPMPVQQRLGESLTQRRVRPKGANYGLHSDVRILAASNQPLREMASNRTFDAALYSAVSATRIWVPPLRERASDIPLLARYFIAQFAEQAGLRHLALTEDAIALLCAFEWPGNIRQLQAVLFRAAVSCQDKALCADDFAHVLRMVRDGGSLTWPSAVAQFPAAGVTLYTKDGDLRPLEDIEADVIRLAIGHYRGRMSEVARKLGIGRSTLYRKLAALGIEHMPEQRDHLE